MLAAGDGSNSLQCGDGNDALTVRGNGSNSITAGNGNDSLIAGNGNNTVNLGDGWDYLLAGDGNNAVTAGNGEDTFSFGNGNNSVTCGNGVDDVGGGNGDNIVNLGNGNDSVLLGSGSNLVVVGNNPEDMISVGDGSNGIDFGTGAYVYLGSGNNTVRQDVRRRNRQCDMDQLPERQWKQRLLPGRAERGHVVHHRRLGRQPGGSHPCHGRGTPTITWQGPPYTPETFFSLAPLGHIDFSATVAPVENTLIEDGVQNSLTLDNDGMVYGLLGIPTNTDVTLSNDTTLCLDQSVTVNTVTLVNGPINGAANVSITANAYTCKAGRSP